MAFVLLESWDAAGSTMRNAVWDTPPAAIARGRRGPAVAASLVLHILLVWVFANRLDDGFSPDSVQVSGANTMTIFKVESDASATAPRSAPAKSEAPPPLPSPERVEVDLSAPNPLPSEWRRTWISDPAPSSTPSEMVSRATSLPGGVPLFDPFAGSAPLRSDPEVTARAGTGMERASAAAAVAELDSAVLRSALAEVRRIHPSASGTVELTLRISRTGRVLDVDFFGGSAPASAKAALRKVLSRRMLYRIRRPPEAPIILRLPTITL